MSKQVADYQLIEELGFGSTGVLYLARCPERLGIEAEVVALKVLDGHASNDEFRRFANEIKIFVAAKSPYLVELHDAGHQEGTLYYAMEFLRRGSLGQATESEALGDGEIVRAVADAARGAHSLHEIGVAHRDIKPSNILMDESGAKLADLGLVQVLAPGTILTRTAGTGPIGSIEFMPPRIALGEKASRATDIWLLGATLHKALAGSSIYGEIPTSSVFAALQHIATTKPEVSEEISEPVRACVVRALSSDPEERYPTAADFANDLEEAV